jgi:hypothetical protein
MRVICSRTMLVPALRTIWKVAKNETQSVYRNVLFSATSGEAPRQGMLRIVSMGMGGKVGLFVYVPATVEQEGQSLVPIEPLNEYVETLRAENLTLYQEADLSTAAREQQGTPSPSHEVREATSPFHIESSFVSEAGTLSMHHAQLKSWACEHYPAAPVHRWLATGALVSILPASFFREAVSDCGLFANEETHRKDEGAEMYGILVRIEEDAIELSATTGTMLISERLSRQNPGSLSFTGLFEGKALAWIRDALAENGSEITLILARDEQSQKPVLLFSMEHTICFCRSLDISSPMSWSRTLQLPHEMEFQVRRHDLMGPLAFYAKVAKASGGISLGVEGTTLSISLFESSDEAVQSYQTLPLVTSSQDLHLLVNPKQFKRLAQIVSEDILRLQVGHFERRNGEEKQRIGFLRASSEQVCVMMSLSRMEEKPEEPSHAALEAHAKPGLAPQRR